MSVVIDFALIGAMKSGTTTLAAWLAAHPRLCMAHKKEPGYFSRDERFARGPDWYASFFQHRSDGQLLGDGSTCYSRSCVFPLAAPRLQQHNPAMRLIYILRHPVERAYSHYAHEMKRLFLAEQPLVPPRTFFETDAECIGASRYAAEIDYIARWFPREQLLVLRFEDVQQNPRRATNEVLSFLGLEMSTGISGPERLNVRGYGVGRKQAERRLTLARHSSPLRVMDIVPAPLRRAGRRAVVNMLHLSGTLRRKDERFLAALAPLTEADRAWLHEQLDPETMRLGEMLRWDVSPWLAGCHAGVAA